MHTTKRFIRRLAATGAATLLALGTAGARAEHSSGWYDWAKVTHVEPIVTRHIERTPVESCRIDTRSRHRHQADSVTPLILGGIVGGVVGNQFGGGSGRKVLTAAGAVLGASVAHDLARGDRYEPRRREVCDTTWHERAVEEVTGYDVTYRYKGETFHRVMDEHPGRRVQVHVRVTPADDSARIVRRDDHPGRGRAVGLTDRAWQNGQAWRNDRRDWHM